ncbi:MAG: type I-E CRISPR-associated protein Cse1/CasA [Gracilibacteraceae bacterium]|nr:type I-E CRISPR-associated protein Cse1/CasA [Gracilibacteraceae bacterium]
MKSEFNLLDENWIIVMNQDGSREEVSLLDVFRRAPEFVCLAGELPTQDVAIMRLLLAIMHAALARDKDTKGKAVKLWKGIWEEQKFEYEPSDDNPEKCAYERIEAYLQKWHDRFFLFDEKYPFYQVHPQNLHDENGQEIIPSLEPKMESFIGDLAKGDKEALFNHRTDCSPTYSEVARWLIYINSFAVSPSGAPPAGRRKIQGFKLPWLCNMGLVWICGETLFETLMLNFTLVCRNGYDYKGCTVRWEQNPEVSAQYLLDIDPVPPKNRPELYTFPFRLVELCRDSDNSKVVKCNIWAGKKLEIANPFIEPMTLLSHVDESTPTFKAGDYIPQQIDESKLMWRDFASILAGNAKLSSGVINWIKILSESGKLKGINIRLNAAGITFKNKTAVKNVFSDSLSFSSSLITKLEQQEQGWAWLISDEIKAAKRLAEATGVLAKSVAESTKTFDIKIKRDRDALKRISSSAEERAYFRLDIPFRQWLADIDPAKHNTREDKSLIIDTWRKTAHDEILKLGEEIVKDAGPSATVGRDGNSAAKAYSKFRSKVCDLTKGENNG